MDEIFNLKKNQTGFALIATLMVMSLLLLLSIYLINFILTENKISQSQAIATQTYYLAESGIAEAIWRIKNDNSWKTNFETNDNWHLIYSREPALYPNGSYTIEITNLNKGRGIIKATGYIDIGGSTAQRVIETTVYKALGESIIGNNGELADGNINFTGTVLNVYNGSVFANGNIIVDFYSTINADDAIRATGNINYNWTSTINASTTESNNFPPAPDPLPMPSISFDDLNDPESLINRADNIYTEKQFSDLMWNNQNLTLNGITYVDGNIEIKGEQNLIINGLLVASGDIEVGKNKFSCCWNGRCGVSNVTINSLSSTEPSGLIAKDDIDFELCLGNFEAKGIIYGNDQINLLSLPGKFDVTGALISRKLNLISVWKGVSITFDSSIVNYGLGSPQFSPIVTVEHWEERY